MTASLTCELQTSAPLRSGPSSAPGDIESDNDQPSQVALIAALGTQDFAHELLRFVRQLCGADICATFLLAQDALRPMATCDCTRTSSPSSKASIYASQYWRRDPLLSQARAAMHIGTSVLNSKVAELDDEEMRSSLYAGIDDRILLCSRVGGCIFLLSILRSSALGGFPESAIDRIRVVSELLMTLVVKHADSLTQFPNPASALQSLDSIEHCLSSMTELPRREMEVCARVIYGLSNLGTSLSLGIGEESVKTYRWRAYRRLSIAGERELLNFYLNLWHEWNARRTQFFGRAPLGWEFPVSKGFEASAFRAAH